MGPTDREHSAIFGQGFAPGNRSNTGTPGANIYIPPPPPLELPIVGTPMPEDDDPADKN